MATLAVRLPTANDGDSFVGVSEHSHTSARHWRDAFLQYSSNMGKAKFSEAIGTTTVGTGSPATMYCPQLLAVVFKKQEILQRVVTRMQDLASEFSKNFRG